MGINITEEGISSPTCCLAAPPVTYIVHVVVRLKVMEGDTRAVDKNIWFPDVLVKSSFNLFFS